jgi:uncharacterized protein with PQ loop repeat
VLAAVLSVVALILTTLRSWPQFVRIVVRREQTGVSALTWQIALAAHTGWFAYGLLAGLPLLVVVNLLAGAGCAATTWVLRSGVTVIAVTAAALAISALAFSVADGVHLAVVTVLAMAMFWPQLVRTFRAPAAGVSPTAWAVSALASTTWLAYAWAIDRPSIVIAHLFMLPAALVILGRRLTGRRPAVRVL